MQFHSIIAPWFQTLLAHLIAIITQIVKGEEWNSSITSAVWCKSILTWQLSLFYLKQIPVLSHYLEVLPCIAGWNDFWMLHNKGCKVDFSCSEFTLCLFLLETSSRFAGHTNRFPSFFDSTRRLTLWNGPTEKLQLILATTDQRDPILLIDILAIAFPIWHHLLDLLGFLSRLVHLTNWYCRSSCS